MALQRTRIDPALPLVWESIDTLRVGFDIAHARISEPSAAAQRLVHRLQRGIVTNTLSVVAAEAGCTPSERDRVQYACAKVLTYEGRDTCPDPTSQPVPAKKGARAPRGKKKAVTTDEAPKSSVKIVAVIGAQKTRARVIRSFEFRGYQAHPAATLQDLSVHTEPAPTLVVFIERFWATPHTLHQLVLLQYPHIMIRFTDQSVRVGPVVLPNKTPCGVCMQLSDSQDDPVLPIIAAQLLRTVPATETPIVTDYAAVIASHMWHAESSSRAPAAADGHYAYQYPVVSGHPAQVPAVHTYRTHEQCGCHMSYE